MSGTRLLNQLTALRTALRTADIEESGSLARVFHAFFDIADEPELIRLGKPAKQPTVRAALERLSRQYLEDDKITLQSLTMLSYAPAGFFHGGFFVSGVVGTFFYFTGEEQGLVAFNSGSPMTHFCRITSTPLPPGTVAMRGPRGKA